jgi:hypothetical protein
MAAEGGPMINELSCEVAIQELFAYIDRALAGAAVDELEEQLGHCLECCDQLAFTRRLDWFVRDRLRRVTAPAGLEDRIRRTLRRASTQNFTCGKYVANTNGPPSGA